MEKKTENDMETGFVEGFITLGTLGSGLGGPSCTVTCGDGSGGHEHTCTEQRTETTNINKQTNHSRARGMVDTQNRVLQSDMSIQHRCPQKCNMQETAIPVNTRDDPKKGVPCLESRVPIIRIMIYWGPHWIGVPH